jgi:hypothetical protein
VLQQDVSVATSGSRATALALSAVGEDLERDCRTWHAALLPTFEALGVRLLALGHDASLPRARRQMIKIRQPAENAPAKPGRLARTMHR